MIQSAKVAYVFPGQGSQSVGMGRDLYDSFVSAKAIFDKADEVLGFSLSELCFEGPEEDLKLTINAQPALVTISFACLQAIREANKLLPPSFVAGHSLGEYTALAAVNVLDFADTVRLARERGRLMHDAGLKAPGGMAAILGLDEAAVAEVCQASGACIANYNCPGQFAISAPKENVPKAIELAKAKGGKALPLAVSGAFHSPLMKPAEEGILKAISNLNFKDSGIPIVANVSAKPLTRGVDIKTELVNQLCNGVQWQRSIEYMSDNGVGTFVEIGPGKVLSGLIKRINKAAGILNISDTAAIKNLG